MKQPTLCLDSISKSFEGMTILNNTNLCCYQGDIIGIRGENGCGKSTLLKIVGGWLRPNFGKVVIDGVDITNWSITKRHMHFIREVTQFPELSKNVSCYDHLCMAAFLRSGIGVFRYLTERISLSGFHLDMVSRFKLDRDLHKPLGSIQYDKQKLICITCALIAAPRVLLLDEPTVGLTLKQRVVLSDLLKSTSRSCAIIIVEHDCKFIQSTCNRIEELVSGEFRRANLFCN